MRRHTYGYLPSFGASPPFHQYQITLLSSRSSLPRGLYSTAQWLRLVPATSRSRVRCSIKPHIFIRTEKNKISQLRFPIAASLPTSLSVRKCSSVFQLVTCIPTRTLPRGMTLGSASNQEVEEIIEKAAEEEDDAAAAARRGQILWVRGLSRLQHQVMTDSLHQIHVFCKSVTNMSLALERVAIWFSITPNSLFLSG